MLSGNQKDLDPDPDPGSGSDSATDKTTLTFRVKEISMGIISNMVYHEAIFSGIMEKDRCLGKHFFFSWVFEHRNIFSWLRQGRIKFCTFPPPGRDECL